MTKGNKSVEQLEAEAAIWATKLDAAPDLAPFGLTAWLQENPKHAGALLRAQAALVLCDEPSLLESPLTPEKKNRTRKRMVLMGSCIATLAACFAAVFLFNPRKEHYETQVGEIRSVALTDGSSISIDAESNLDVVYDNRNRTVHMNSGKAVFHAVHDIQRPFRVTVDTLVITDIGTIFQVTDQDSAGNIEILVTQGAVSVDSPAGRINITEGHSARFSKPAINTPQPQISTVGPVAIERLLAWREGRLELNGETLNSAVEEINRHNRMQTKIATTALGQEKLYGVFRVDDAVSFAQAAAVSLDTQMQIVRNNIVIGPVKKNKQLQ